MRASLQEGDWDVIVSDHNVPGFNALAALELRRQFAPDLPFIIVSAVIGEEAAVNAMKAGASDFAMKSALARLAPAVRRELSDAIVRRERGRVE